MKTNTENNVKNVMKINYDEIWITQIPQSE